MAGESPTWLDWLIFALLVALLAFMPLAFGVVDPLSELIAFTTGAAIALLLGVRMVLAGGRTPLRPLIFLPIAIFVALALLQLAPLPAGIVRLISPHTVFTKSDLLRDVPGAESFLKSITLSFYPLDTRLHLRFILLAGIIFSAVLSICRSSHRIRAMLIAVALIGGVMGTLALTQGITRTKKTFWVLDLNIPPFNATFANHGHYAQFMNLAIGATLALLLVRLRGTTTLLSDGYDGPAEVRIRQNIWWPSAVIVIGMATVALSLSRGGVVALGVAAIFTILLLSFRRAARPIAGGFTLMLIAGAACVMVIGFEQLYYRLHSLGNVETFRPRLQPAIDAMSIYKRFPIFGIGLGAHEAVFPRFKTLLDPARTSHLENEYAQVAEEMGTLGLICLVTFVGVVWAHFARSMKRTDSPTAAASAGLGYGLLAVMIHSLSDFAQHIPAVTGLSAVTCALIINASRVDLPPAGSLIAFPRRLLGAIVVIAALGFSAWLIPDAYASFRAREAWDRIKPVWAAVFRKDWDGTSQEYAVLIGGATAASELQPENVEHRYWMNEYRWREIEKNRNPNRGEISLSPLERESAARIVQNLQQSRLLCPTYGPTYALLGRIELLALGRPEGEIHIQQAFALSPNYWESCFLAGLVDVRRGQWESCIDKFRRAFAINRGLFQPIVVQLADELKRPDLAIGFLDDNVEDYFSLAGELMRRQQTALAAAATKKATEILDRRLAQGTAKAPDFAMLASMEVQHGNLATAVEHYAKALDLNVGRIDWRIARGRALVKLGRLAEAANELALCRKINPNDPNLGYFVSELDEAIRRRNKPG